MNVAVVRLRMHHTDLAGIFHGRVFDLFEEGRTEVFRRLGFEYRTVIDRGQAMVAIHVDAAFVRPIRVLDEELAISVFITHLSRARITVAYDIRRPGELKPAATGHTAFAFIDVARSRPVPVPAEIVAAIARCPDMLRLT